MHLLRWKLGEAYSPTTSGMKAADLKQLWEVWKDMEVADIELHPAPAEPVKRKFEEAITAGDNLLNGEDFLELAEKFKQIAQQKGVTIELNNEQAVETQS